MSVNKVSFDFERIYGISLVPLVPRDPRWDVVPLAFVCPVFCEGFKELPPQSSLSAFRLVLRYMSYLATV